LLGDAAGLTDPLTGEGIYYAILSAQLAASAIGNYFAKSGGGVQEYQQLVENKILSELRITHTLSRYFVRFPRMAFRMLSKSDGVWKAERDVILGETDYSAVKEKIGGFKGILTHLLRF
jgi:flavin-dependent dehydrogenase